VKLTLDQQIARLPPARPLHQKGTVKLAPEYVLLICSSAGPPLLHLSWCEAENYLHNADRTHGTLLALIEL
jgi:hypothetical protein